MKRGLEGGTGLLARGVEGGRFSPYVRGEDILSLGIISVISQPLLFDWPLGFTTTGNFGPRAFFGTDGQ
jgi:hypothetical protein